VKVKYGSNEGGEERRDKVGAGDGSDRMKWWWGARLRSCGRALPLMRERGRTLATHPLCHALATLLAGWVASRLRRVEPKVSVIGEAILN
jgi:hypothetical protein